MIDETLAKEKFSALPVELHGFTFENIFSREGDKFYYFDYADKKNRRAVTAYFHDETQEYKVRVKIGLNEFCLTNFFTSDFDKFCEMICPAPEILLKFFEEDSKLALLTGEKNFADWNYGKNLPPQLEGFELFISPQNPVAFTNGSMIVINYSNFATDSDLTIYYNIYSDNFSGEVRLRGTAQVIYLFDANDLKTLQDKLEKNLAAELANIKNLCSNN